MLFDLSRSESQCSHSAAPRCTPQYCGVTPQYCGGDGRAAERGQMIVAAVVLVMFLVLVAGGAVDLYRLQETRNWAYRTAEAAALAGAVLGRDLSSVYTTGQVRVDPVNGYLYAEEAALDALARRGAVGSYDIRVIEWGGETVTNYPPVARADMWDSGSWTSSEPAVGVYLEIEVDTFLYCFINGGGPVTVHAFAAAGVATR